MSMKQVNLYEAKTNLSALVDQAADGEDIVIAKNGKPRAVIVSLDRAPARPRRVPKFGAWAHEKYEFPENFNDPDPEIEALFYGEDGPAS
jgi:prevent-host-death family protein